MISKNHELLDRVRSKIISGACDVARAVDLMDYYLFALGAHNRGLVGYEAVTEHEEALLRFLED